jgi:hypothetical protein
MINLFKLATMLTRQVYLLHFLNCSPHSAGALTSPEVGETSLPKPGKEAVESTRLTYLHSPKTSTAATTLRKDALANKGGHVSPLYAEI